MVCSSIQSKNGCSSRNCNLLLVEPNKVGEYEVLCVEYCGVGHYAMRGGVIVQDDQDYKNWLEQQETFSDLIAKQQKIDKKKLAKKIN